LVKSAIRSFGIDWLNIKERWDSVSRKTPPVFIAVTNRKETAARVTHHILNGYSSIQELEDRRKIFENRSRCIRKIRV
jgi:hypothetical protein